MCTKGFTGVSGGSPHRRRIMLLGIRTLWCKKKKKKKKKKLVGLQINSGSQHFLSPLLPSPHPLFFKEKMHQTYVMNRTISQINTS
jgi:hypothetical protein